MTYPHRAGATINEWRAKLSNTARMRLVMRGANFATPSLDARPRPRGAEPEFTLRSAPRSPDPTATSNPRMLSGVEGVDGMPVTLAPRSSASRRGTTSAAPPVGNVLSLFLIGLVAIATIGVFFGAGFVLLAPPAKDTIADSSTSNGNPPPPYDNPPRAGMAVPRPTAMATLPGSPLAQPPQEAEAPPLRQSNAAESSPPVPPSNEVPSQAESKPEPASSSTDPTAPPTDLASQRSFSAQDSVQPGGAKRRPTRDGRSN